MGEALRKLRWAQTLTWMVFIIGVAWSLVMLVDILLAIEALKCDLRNLGSLAK